MQVQMNASQFQRLEALHTLLEESQLALIETQVSRHLVTRLARLVARRSHHIRDENWQRKCLAAQYELAELTRTLNHAWTIELTNGRFFTQKIRELLKETTL